MCRPTGKVRRLLMLAPVAASLVFAACAHRQSDAEVRARALQRPPGRMVATAGGQWAPDCPLAVSGTEVVVTDLEDGAALVLTTRGGNVQELRRRALSLAASYNEGYDNKAPPAVQRYVESPRTLAGGGYGARGGEGSKEIEVPGRPPSRATVEMIPNGAKILYRTSGKAEVYRVRSRVSREAVQMWAGACPTVG